MPSHRKFLESIGFKKFSNYGWRVLNNHLKEIHTQESKKVYLYPRLDQYELREQLEDLPTEEDAEYNFIFLRFAKTST